MRHRRRKTRLNRQGYYRTFVSDVRHLGESLHVRQLEGGGGVRRRDLYAADLWDVDYDPGTLVFPDHQRVRLTWIPSPLLAGGRRLFICPDCGRRCCELFRFYQGVGPWKCRKCLGLVYRSSYKNRYIPKTKRGVNYGRLGRKGLY